MPKKGYRKPGAKARSVQQRKYNSRPDQKRRRAQRNAARRSAAKKGLVRKGDKKDVHHVNPSKRGPLNNKKTRVVSRSKNRADNGRSRKRSKGKR